MLPMHSNFNIKSFWFDIFSKFLLHRFFFKSNMVPIHWASSLTLYTCIGFCLSRNKQSWNSVKIHHVHENLLTFRKKKLCMWLETEKQMHSNTFKLVLSDKYDLFTYIYISKCKFLRHFFHHLMIRWKLVVLSFFLLINN